jgi:hypothetical protein
MPRGDLNSRSRAFELEREILLGKENQQGLATLKIRNATPNFQGTIII